MNKKIFIWIIIITLFTVLILLGNTILTFRDKDSKIKSIFAKELQEVIIHHETYNNLPIRYISDKTYNKDLPTVIFIHGAPGSLSNYYTYLQNTELRNSANLIAVDRLGYGYSNFGQAETSIQQQSDMIDFIAKKYSNKGVIVSGWSYGGPIALKSLIDHDYYTEAIIVAPAVSPEHEKHFWLGYFAKWKATQWLVPRALVVAEMEKLSHTSELQKLESDYQYLEKPVTHFHGTNDRIVPYENLDYLNSHINPDLLTSISIPKGNHMIHFDNQDLIIRTIQEAIERIDK